MVASRYELALLSAAHLRARGVSGVELSLVTHERDRWSCSARVRRRSSASSWPRPGSSCGRRSAPRRFDRPRTRASGRGEIAADRVVALPALEVPEIDGIPQRNGGFIPTDTRLNVEGMTDVWAVGDATWFPIKQGGLAAQQADVAAEAIASRAGAQVPISTFRPVLRAALLTGALPRYFRSALFAGFDDAASPSALWSPPTKLAGRYLGSYLSAAAHWVMATGVRRPRAAGAVRFGR